ncbi:DUF5103 domain-containing protein [Plebeiibacterium marinum]|uniref:DUF5103 domain-containing protein n=1 Tax=Plebeiibacterium marinum TaxID=2992111 RepID=A0AAE3MC41_9BACT|nr:DUF5103 domain-containing protein [Plebeiobacterium marinum]MCW3804988.1 DUF5103 domain-containing protein [Plebeiobacterium marinum]
MWYVRYVVLLLFVSGFQYSGAQSLNNFVYSQSIKTVMCHKEGWPMSYPVIQLGTDEKIELSFDDLNNDSRSYYYSLVHCNSHWEPSDISEQEYVNGINQVPVLDFDFSFNTTVEYVHYKMQFPNEDIGINYSGNYIILVYEDFNREAPVLARRFMVVERKVQVQSQIKFAMNSSLRKQQQDINFTVTHRNFEISNPLHEVTVSIYQNQRLDNAIHDIKPQFIKPESLEYNYNRETMFEGGNEFRWLDLRTYEFRTEDVSDIHFHDPYYHLDLKPDESRNEKSYFFQNDFNGRYVIENREGRDPFTESDYVLVHFFLPRNEPFAGGDIYIMGGLTNWRIDDSSVMRYNPQFKRYEKTLLLKQGFYNYLYAFKTPQTDQATVSILEGSYSEAENDYLFLVYYRDISDNYDRLIGVAQSNSVKP